MINGKNNVQKQASFKRKSLLGDLNPDSGVGPAVENVQEKGKGYRVTGG